MSQSIHSYRATALPTNERDIMTIKHTILGANGIIGRTLAEHLRSLDTSVRFVDRAPATSQGDTIHADLLDLEQTRHAVADADVVHFAVGLPYDNAVWATQFPAILKNVIAALEGSYSRLVFMDNVYMYGKVNGAMTEDQAHNAATVKGLARKNLIDQLSASKIDYVVARSADFYGPGANSNSLLNLFILANLKAARPANWLGGVDFKHSFTYTRDIAAAMVVLAEAQGVSRTTWHIPTVAPALTIRELAQHGAEALGSKDPTDFQILTLAAVTEYAKQDVVMEATSEMFYQFDSDYVFDSSRYEKRFSIQPTPFDTGIRETLALIS